MEKEYLIKKWLTNNLTEDELKAFELLEDHTLHTDIIENAKYFKASHFSKTEGFEKLESRNLDRVPVRKLNWMRPLMRLAAVFVMGLGVYFLFFFNNLTHIQTLASQKTTIELPDESLVTLNAFTEISYHKNNWNKNREVHLNGEAFFKVAKGEVFDVVTENGTVTVVGTQFNVKQRDNYFEVKCYEGIVKVETNNTTKELLAGDTFRLYGNSITFSTTSYQLPQWTKDVSDFRSVPFGEVIAELERQYNISVTYDIKNATRIFSGGFVHNNLDNALKSITEPLELTYIMDSSNKVRLQSSGR
ncbi:MAG: FecR domain-containing protein [Flavobacteriaceae bacterium]|nr:FecR domain-containing protein [Flavobacteriaceae bacterium]